MSKQFLLTLLCIFTITTSQAYEDDTEFQISIVPDLAVLDRNTEVKGLSLNLLWGENPQENCLAIGFINGSTGDSNGASIGLINYTDNYSGLQLGLYNSASKRIHGTQLGIVNQARSVKGAQIGLINTCDNLNQGIQFGLINVNSHKYPDTNDHSAYIMPILNWNF